MIDLTRIANLIEPSRGVLIKHKNNYNTRDIMVIVLRNARRAHKDVSRFAASIPKASLYVIAYSLWYFLKKHIRYDEDGMRYQAIRTPAALWSSKNGDCKSFTVFIIGVLRALGVPCSVRFVSYSSDPNHFTHVYAVAHGPDKDYIIDPVWTGPFNTEKDYKFKKDYKMERGLYTVGSVGATERRNMNTQKRKGVLRISDDPSEAELAASIIRQRLEIERDILNDKGRIGKVDEYDRTLDVLDEFIGATQTNDFATMDSVISGIGRRRGRGRGRKFLNKIKNAAKSYAKGLAKVVTFPARQGAKLVLRVLLPKAAPMFLYLFIKDKNMLQKLPPVVRQKQKQQAKIANFIVKGLGMKRSNLMGILRNGIMKKYRKSPEKVLAQQFKGIDGIGFAVSVAALVPVVIKIIQKVAAIIGKKKEAAGLESAAQSMGPGDGDFASASSSVRNAAASDFYQTDLHETAPGNTIQDFEDTQDIIPADGGSRGPRGICG